MLKPVVPSSGFRFLFSGFISRYSTPMNAFRTLSVALVTLLASVTFAKAELPPDAYRRFQAEATEVLQIKVDQVSSKFVGFLDWSKRIETVQATVQKVTRSKSGVKAGDKITVRYERLLPKKGWAGPSPAPTLQRGKEYPAYLEKTTDGTFDLGAQGKSFTEIK